MLEMSIYDLHYFKFIKPYNQLQTLDTTLINNSQIPCIATIPNEDGTTNLNLNITDNIDKIRTIIDTSETEISASILEIVKSTAPDNIAKKLKNKLDKKLDEIKENKELFIYLPQEDIII